MRLTMKRNARGLATRHPIVPWLFLLPAIALLLVARWLESTVLKVLP